MLLCVSPLVVQSNALRSAPAEHGHDTGAAPTLRRCLRCRMMSAAATAAAATAAAVNTICRLPMPWNRPTDGSDVAMLAEGALQTCSSRLRNGFAGYCCCCKRQAFERLTLNLAG